MRHSVNDDGLLLVQRLPGRHHLPIFGLVMRCLLWLQEGVIGLSFLNSVGNDGSFGNEDSE
jgi:hypothetical protein